MNIRFLLHRTQTTTKIHCPRDFAKETKEKKWTSRLFKNKQRLKLVQEQLVDIFTSKQKDYTDWPLGDKTDLQ